jgi:ferredoxin-NADP reductase
MSTLSSRLAAALAYPRAFSDYIELAFPLHSEREVRARVVGVRRETRDVTTLVLKPNRLWAGHRAGQYVALAAEIGGVRRTRCFSISSAEGAAPEITIKARPGGAVTPALVFGEMKGAIVTLSQAQGDFVLPEVLPERILFVSGGSGITPVMSMLRTLGLRVHGSEILFVHYARSPADVIFAEELSRYPNVRVETCRHVDELRTIVPDYESWETWACGPEPMLECLRGMIPKLHVERFALPVVGTEAEVKFTRSKKQRSGAGSLLVMAEQAGLTPPSGCRMGICHTCTCRKVSGVTRDLRTGEVSTDENVDIQLCTSAPVGAVEIDL